MSGSASPLSHNRSLENFDICGSFPQRQTAGRACGSTGRWYFWVLSERTPDSVEGSSGFFNSLCNALLEMLNVFRSQLSADSQRAGVEYVPL